MKKNEFFFFFFFFLVRNQASMEKNERVYKGIEKKQAFKRSPQLSEGKRW